MKLKVAFDFLEKILKLTKGTVETTGKKHDEQNLTKLQLNFLFPHFAITSFAE